VIISAEASAVNLGLLAVDGDVYGHRHVDCAMSRLCRDRGVRRCLVRTLLQPVDRCSGIRRSSRGSRGIRCTNGTRNSYDIRVTYRIFCATRATRGNEGHACQRTRWLSAWGR